MARWYESRPDQEAMWASWIAERPPAVRAVAERFVPWELYRLRTTGQIVIIAGFSELKGDEAPTVRANILRDPRGPHLERFQVYGLAPDEFEVYEPASHDELIALARRAAGDHDEAGAA